MKIEHMQYFITIANSSSISKASEKLFISKQQLTRILATLEEELGVQLTKKSSNGITLTEEGLDFLQYCKVFVSEYNAMKNHFFMQKNLFDLETFSESATCKIYLPPSIAIFSTDIVKNLKKNAPNIELCIYEKNTSLTVDYFDNDAICFWLLDIPEKERRINNTPLCIHEIGKAVIFYVYNKSLNHLGDASISFDKILSTSFSHTYNLNLNKERLHFVSSNIYHLLESVLHNNYICTLPDFLLPKISAEYPDVSFSLVPDYSTPINIVYPETHILTKADQIVINYIKSYIQTLQILSNQV